jgi:ParB-like chromosome segregation protein Spo0J
MTTEAVTTHTANRRKVKLGDLRLDFKNWTNPRTVTGLDDPALDELADNLRKRGMEIPPHVAQIKANGDIVDLVIDGQRRVMASLRFLPKTTEIEVIDVEPIAVDLTPEKAAELTERALNITTNRAELSSYEICEAAAKLKAQGVKLSRIATAVHRSETWVSKMLSAREGATPKLVHSWQKSEITDEQFKDIAREKSPNTQNKTLEDVKAARESGDKASARVMAKEVAETSRAPKLVLNGTSTNGHAKEAPVVKGPQVDLFEDRTKKEKEGPVAPSKAVLHDMLSFADKKPPTHEYVKGVMDGLKVALGFTNPEKLGKPWVTYLARCEGRAVVKKGKAKRAAKKSKGKSKKSRR